MVGCFYTPAPLAPGAASPGAPLLPVSCCVSLHTFARYTHETLVLLSTCSACTLPQAACGWHQLPAKRNAVRRQPAPCDARCRSEPLSAPQRPIKFSDAERSSAPSDLRGKVEKMRRSQVRVLAIPRRCLYAPPRGHQQTTLAQPKRDGAHSGTQRTCPAKHAATPMRHKDAGVARRIGCTKLKTNLLDNQSAAPIASVVSRACSCMHSMISWSSMSRSWGHEFGFTWLPSNL